MSSPERPTPSSPFLDAIRAKRDRHRTANQDMADLESALVKDIEAFDLDAAEARARREYLTQGSTGMADPTLVFPDLGALPANRESRPPVTASAPPEAAPAGNGGLLDQLRRQAAVRQRELHTELAERSAVNDQIDRVLKQTFFFLHELVQQLNIVKPEVPRDYPLIEQHGIDGLTWQEGFADYRTQSQSRGAMVELVSFSYRLSSPKTLHITRDSTAFERFRKTLFDYGLQFTCKEYKNERQYVERADFDIRGDLSVTARWRADFERGLIVLETRNIERLGSAVFTMQPAAIDQALLDEFGRMILAEPNRFRELAKRQAAA